MKRVTGVVSKPQKKQDRNQLELGFIVEEKQAKREEYLRRQGELGKFGGNPTTAREKDHPQRMVVRDPRTGLIETVVLTDDGYKDAPK